MMTVLPQRPHVEQHLVYQVLNEDHRSHDACLNGTACGICHHLVVKKGTANTNNKPPVFYCLSLASLVSLVSFVSTALATAVET